MANEHLGFKALEWVHTKFQIEIMANSWWEDLSVSNEATINNFISQLFFCGGLNIKDFTPTAMRPQQLILVLNNQDADYQSALCLKKIFIKRFKPFFDQILEKNNWCLLFNSFFIDKILRNIGIMKKACWESFRILFTVTALRILKHSLMAKIYVTASPSESSESNINKCKAIKGRLFQLIFENYRDKSPYIRAMALKEFSEWTEMVPEFGTERLVHEYIMMAARDPSGFVKTAALVLLEEMFKSRLNEEDKLRLYTHTKKIILRHLTSPGDSFNLRCLNILTHIKRIFSLGLTNYEVDYVCMCIFNKNNSISVVASVLFFELLLIEKSPQHIIMELVQFHQRTPVKSYALLTDSLSWKLAEATDWADWNELISQGSQQDIVDILNIFYSFAYGLLTNYSPRPNPVRPHKGEIEVKTLREGFTRYFSGRWTLLINEKKIVEQVPALSVVLKIPRLFCKDVSQEVLSEIAETLKELFLSSDNDATVSHSFNTLSAICGLSSSLHLKELIETCVRSLTEDFINHITHKYPNEKLFTRMATVSKHWTLSDRLQEGIGDILTKTIYQLKTSSGSNLVPLGMATVLVSFHLVMKDIENLSNLHKQLHPDDSTLNEIQKLTSRSKSRGSYLLEELPHFLEERFSDKLRETFFPLCMELIAFFGLHNMNHSVFGSVVVKIPEDSFDQIMNFAVRYLHSPCNNEGGSDEGFCCRVILDTCNLLAKGRIHIKNLIHFITELKEGDVHNKYVMALMEGLIVTEKKTEEIAYVIFNSLLKSVNEERKTGSSVDTAMASAKSKLKMLLKKLNSSPFLKRKLTSFVGLITVEYVTKQGSTYLLSFLNDILEYLEPADIQMFNPFMRAA